MINAKAVKSLVKTRKAVASTTEGSRITAIVQIKRQNSVPNFQDELYQAVQRSDRRALKSMLTRPEVLSFVRQERFQPVTCETHHSQAVTCSPLHYSLDSTRAMEMLLKAGANPNAELVR